MVSGKSVHEDSSLHAEVCQALLSAQQPEGEQPPHLEINVEEHAVGSVLHWAVARRLQDAALVILKCQHFQRLNAKRGLDGSTALHVAAAEGLSDVVQALLVHKGFHEVPALDKDGFTALHGAAYRGHLECVRLLLACRDFQGAAGASGAFDVVRPRGHWATEAASQCDVCTAFHAAAAGGSVECCEAILASAKQANVNAANRTGATALHMAARAGHTAVCRAILRHSAFQAVNAQDARGFTALHWAVQANSDICVAILARQDFTSAEAKDLRGRTAAEIAQDCGHHEIRRLLIAHMGPQALSGKAL